MPDTWFRWLTIAPLGSSIALTLTAAHSMTWTTPPQESLTLVSFFILGLTCTGLFSSLLLDSDALFIPPELPEDDASRHQNP